jgi:hypothetical protein
MPERRFETGPLRKLASAALAFQTWLDGGAASADTDGQAREAHRQLRALSRSRPPSGTTHIYDALGRLIQMTDAPAPADYALRLGDAGELLVTTRTDVFVFVLDAHEVLHFVARRPLAAGTSEGDRPS